MLDEFANLSGHNFPDMDGLAGMLSKESVLFDPINNGGEGNPLVVGTVQPVLDVAIVVSSYRNIGIINQRFINSEFFEDVALNERRDTPGFLMPGVGNGKPLGVFPASLQKYKEPGFPHTQHLLNIDLVYFMVDVPLNELFDLMIRKTYVYLCHTQKPLYMFLSNLYPRCPLLNLK